MARGDERLATHGLARRSAFFFFLSFQWLGREEEGGRPTRGGTRGKGRLAEEGNASSETKWSEEVAGAALTRRDEREARQGKKKRKKDARPTIRRQT